MLKLILCLYFNIVNSFNLPFLHNTNFHIEPIKQITDSIPHEYKVNIIKESTSLLPRLDWFSHAVLKNNEKLTNFILDSDLPNDQKKKLILDIVKYCMKGDEMGGDILIFYYNLINSIL